MRVIDAGKRIAELKMVSFVHVTSFVIFSGGFDDKTLESQEFEARAKWLFLFYLVYGEIHEFRNTKNVLNVLYHCALTKYIANDEKDGKVRFLFYSR